MLENSRILLKNSFISFSQYSKKIWLSFKNKYKNSQGNYFFWPFSLSILISLFYLVFFFSMISAYKDLKLADFSSFLTAFSTTISIVWIACGIFFSSRQLNLQIEDLRLQRSELEKQTKALTTSSLLANWSSLKEIHRLSFNKLANIEKNIIALYSVLPNKGNVLVSDNLENGILNLMKSEDTRLIIDSMNEYLGVYKNFEHHVLSVENADFVRSLYIDGTHEGMLTNIFKSALSREYS